MQKNINGYLQNFYDKNANGKIYLSTDKNLYTTGEEIWVSALLLDRKSNLLKEGGKVLHLQLVGPSGEKFMVKDIQLANGKGEGYLLIPTLNVFGKFLIEARIEGNTTVSFRKEVFIRKNAIPPFLIDINFKEKYYGGGDELKVVFTATDFFRKPIKGAEFKLSLFLDQKEIHTDNGKLDKDGTGIMNINLPDSLPKGSLVFSISIFEKELEEISIIEIPVKTEDIYFNFYPEGGQLVHGLINFLKIKAVDKYGIGFGFEADVLNQEGKIISTITSKPDGTAVLPFLPDYKNQLKLSVRNPYSIERKYDLPKIRPFGFNLSLIKMARDSVFLSLKKTQGDESETILLNINQGKAYQISDFKLDEKSNICLSKKILKPGINQLVLFHENSQPLTEILVFIAPKINHQITAKTNKQEYRDREKVGLEIVSNKTGIATLSISDEHRTMNGVNKQNILTSLYIDSELKNNLELGANEFDDRVALEDKMYANLPYQSSINSWTDIFLASSLDAEYVKNENKEGFAPSITQLYYLGSENGFLHYNNYNYDNYYLASNPSLLNQLKSTIKKDKIEPYYKRILESGQPVREAVFAIKPYQLYSGKIVFPGTLNSLNYQSGALIIVDNIRVGDDVSNLDNINPYEVDNIFVSTNVADISSFTSLNSVGVIQITTKRGNTDQEPEEPETNKYFEYVDHEMDEKFWKNIKDLRTTIHWEPFLTVGEISNQIKFYQSDIRSIFIGTLEGIDEKGQPLYYRFEYKSNSYPDNAQ